jgi:diguanylate cyclase (GGDEF)-like protein
MVASPNLYVVMLILASASGMVASGVALARWRSHGATAFPRVDNWRQTLENLAIESPKGVFHVTTSIGVSIYPLHAASADDLLHAADDALYAAKGAGKNRVFLSSS